MTTDATPALLPATQPAVAWTAAPNRLRTAIAAFLAGYKPTTRRVYANVLKTYTGWCAQNGIDPMTVRRFHIELFIRWLEELGRARNTRAKYASGVCLFYRFMFDEHFIDEDPGVRVARPKWDQESSAIGLTHLQFEALLHAGEESANRYDYALVCMLGLLGLRRAEASNARVEHLALSRGHWVLRVVGKGEKFAFVPLPPAVHRAIERAVGDRTEGWILLNSVGHQVDGRSMTLRLRALAAAGGVRVQRIYPHALRHSFVTTMLDAGVDLRDVQIAARHSDPKTTMRYDRNRQNLDRHANYILAAYMAGSS